MQSILDFLGSSVSSFANFIKLQFEYLVSAICSFCVYLSSYLVSCFDGIINAIGSYYSMFVSVIQTILNFIVIYFESYLDYCRYYYLNFSDRLYDMVLYFLKFSFYWLLCLFDFLMNLSFDLSMYLIELLPEISLPSGFDVGMRYFLGFGMILNSFFPFAEMVGFVCIVLSVRIFAFCIKFIPYIGGVVR
jgi:hypothetical protein